jgi:hypothetical protein
MSGNPRENVRDQGFWDGGGEGQGGNDQASGRTSGFPGVRSPKHTGIRTDIEFPETSEQGLEEPPR